MNLIAAESEYGDMMIKGLFQYQFFGHTVYITTTQVTLLVVSILILIFCILAHHRMKHPSEVPGTFQNIVELIVEKLGSMTEASMHSFAGTFFKDFTGALFLFIIVCNLTGLIGLRPPTADYGVTLPLGLLAFFMIQINGIRVKKWGHFKGLAEPLPLLLPSNLIGEISVPISLSLRLFGNILSGTMIMALWYAMIPALAKVIVSPFLHAYLDVFAGCIQAYVFTMLTMTYMTDKME